MLAAALFAGCVLPSVLTAYVNPEGSIAKAPTQLALDAVAWIAYLLLGLTRELQSVFIFSWVRNPFYQSAQGRGKGSIAYYDECDELSHPYLCRKPADSRLQQSIQYRGK